MTDLTAVPSDDDVKATFEGTPAEIVSWVQTHFAIMHNIVEGALESASEEDKAGFESMMDSVDRSVYKVTIEPLSGMVAKQRVRPEYMARVGRIETGLELFDLLAKGVNGPTNPDE